MRATFCGLIGMFIISLLFQLVGTEVKDEWDYGFLFLVFTICAISQLIKQVKEWVGMEDNQNDKKYIIEIKSGLYVSTNAFGNVYSFTKNIEKAIKTSYLDSAMDIAERCYGTVKEYRMKHEILEVVE